MKSRQHLKLLTAKHEVEVLIDYGCGSGEWLADVHLILGSQTKLIGVDHSESKPHLLSRHGIEYLRNSELGSLESHTIDACRMIQVIEHLDDVRGVLEQVQRLLKSNGRLLIETPVASGWDFKIGRLGTWGGWHAPRHFHVFSIESLRKTLVESGFDLVQEKYIFGPYVWAETLRARFDNRRPTADSFFNISNPLCLVLVATFDLMQRLLRLPTSNYRLIARPKAD